MRNIKNIYYTSNNNFNKTIMYMIDVENLFEQIIVVNGNERNIQENKLDKDILDEKVDTILSITSSWKEKYTNNKILDGIEYKFAIEYGDGSKKIVQGKNKFPNNYLQFINVLGV